MGYLAQNGVAFHTEHKMTKITDKGVVFENLVDNSEVMVEADVVVLSLGVCPNTALAGLGDVFDKALVSRKILSRKSSWFFLDLNIFE